MGNRENWSQLIFGALTLQRSNRPGASVGLTIRFGLEKFWIRRRIWPRSIRIGVREADFKFVLTDAIMPDEDWTYERLMSPRLDVKRTEFSTLTTLGENQLGNDLTATLAGALKAGSKESQAEASLNMVRAVKKSEKNSEEQKKNITEEYSYKKPLVTSSGGPANPCWNIKSVLAKDFLRGLAIKTGYFARIVENGAAPSVSLVAEIPSTGVLVEDETGCFETLNKRIVARRRIQKALCDHPIVLHDPITLETMDAPSAQEGDSE